MSWMGVGAVVLAAAVVVIVAAFMKRPVRDLGSVSSHWIAEHGADG